MKPSENQVTKDFNEKCDSTWIEHLFVVVFSCFCCDFHSPNIGAMVENAEKETINFLVPTLSINVLIVYTEDLSAFLLNVCDRTIPSDDRLFFEIFFIALPACDIKVTRQSKGTRTTGLATLTVHLCRTNLFILNFICLRTNGTNEREERGEERKGAK